MTSESLVATLARFGDAERQIREPDTPSEDDEAAQMTAHITKNSRTCVYQIGLERTLNT